MVKHAAMFVVVILAAASIRIAQQRDAPTASSNGEAPLQRDELVISVLRGQELQQVLRATSVYPLGSKQNPVRSLEKDGELAYLARLRCTDGKAPEATHADYVMDEMGSRKSILDVYELRCSSGTPTAGKVYMDMFNWHVENRPIPGFMIDRAENPFAATTP